MKGSHRKAEILETAARLFKERGFSAVSMRDIATELHIKAASLYNHIHSKQEILEDIIMPLAEDYTAGMQEIINGNHSPTEQLEKIIDKHVDISIRNPQAIASLNNEWMNLEENALNRFLAMREAYEQNFRQILRSGIESGEFKPLDVDLTIFVILSTLRTLHLWYQRKKSLRGDALTAELKNLILRGVCAI